MINTTTPAHLGSAKAQLKYMGLGVGTVSQSVTGQAQALVVSSIKQVHGQTNALIKQKSVQPAQAGALVISYQYGRPVQDINNTGWRGIII